MRSPGVEDVFPATARMQRAILDLTASVSRRPDTTAVVAARGLAGRRISARRGRGTLGAGRAPIDDYAFVRVEGDGVHEIAVGPVHAGIIEPGHFRFSVVGEKVLRLEERLGYVHKGIERRFTELPILEGHRLAARVSGDCGRRLFVGLLPGARAHGRSVYAAACSVAAGTGARTRAHREPSRRPRRPGQRRRVCLRPVAVPAAQGRPAPRKPAGLRAALPARFRRPGRHEQRSFRRRRRCAQAVHRRRLRRKCRACAASTTSTPACATASQARGPLRRSSRPGSASSESPGAPARSRSTCAWTRRSRPIRSST